MLMRFFFALLLITGVLIFFLSKTNHLNLIYKNSCGSFLRPLLIRKWASSLAGWYANSSLSRIHISTFVKNNRISMNESAHPLSSFTTFNQFFIRKLTKDARPIAPGKNALVSPADSYVMGIKEIQLNDQFPIKGCRFNLAEALGSKQRALDYEQGSLLIFRLAPYHYHRFHFPIDCTPQAMHCITGLYDSVNPLVFKQNLQPLETNERCIIALEDTPAQDMIIMPVGALFVGAITSTYQAGKEYKKGAEAGYFSFGGSTILLLTKKGSIQINEQILNNSLEDKETEVKMGESVATLIH